VAGVAAWVRAGWWVGWRYLLVVKHAWARSGLHRGGGGAAGLRLVPERW